MKLCQTCGQLLAEDITSCPTCGSEVAEGRRTIDQYRIVKVLHEGYATTLCQAVNDLTEEPVMIRIFSAQSGVDEAIAERLKKELEELKKLPDDYFVRHYEIRQSSDGLWYRVSEWLDTENWGSLIASGVFQDYRIACRLFYRIASILEGLHRIGHFIPHLILDDILAVRADDGELQIQIDYKLSRFFDPKLDRPGPMLKYLLSCHPDIVHERPLDFRSDIWSLGKIFVELLTARHESSDFKAEIDTISLSPDITLLLKSMLADDPNLRPQSMAEVAETLSRIKEKDLETAMRRRREAMQPPVHEFRSLKKRIGLLALLIGVTTIVALLVWFFFVFRQKDTEKILGMHANRYARSVAFVLTEYWLTAGESVIYRSRSEGTAFLVDRQGYLLTNRHVACPWLEDNKLLLLIRRYSALRRSIQLGYRAFLWFEGQKAFKHIPDVAESKEIEDTYVLSSAFRSDVAPRLSIAGVARAPDRTYQLIRSPLKEDFAVLKIDRVPEDLLPLPLDQNMEALKIPKLSPVIALGFPLGRRTQAATINVSVTRGHVRRTFENLLQVDSSIHRGNSGGPIIDLRGKVIGIASGVALDWTDGPLPVPTLLSDMGMVLPINKAARFLQELQGGKKKWNGVLDLSIDSKISAIMDLAEAQRWSEAQLLADKELEQSFDPTLVMAGGIIHFCAGDNIRAGRLFEQALSMDDRNDLARLILYLIDWCGGRSAASTYRKVLLSLDWRSAHELFGYLVRVLEGDIDEDIALKGGYTDDERNWLRFAVAMTAIKKNESLMTEKLLQPVLLTTGRENWLYFLALANLAEAQQQNLERIDEPAARRRYQAEIDQFAQKLEESRPELAQRRSRAASLEAKLRQRKLAPHEKRMLLEQLLQIDPDNANLLVQLVYNSARVKQWEQALAYARKYLSLDGRESAGRLQLGLMAAEVLHNMGLEEEALLELEAYRSSTREPWYRLIAESIVDKEKESALFERAGAGPEYVLTANTALGLWAEGSEDQNGAINYYREALGSYMDDMIEYGFALERVKRLRQEIQ